MSELIDKIAADTEIEMTDDLIRAFRACGCDPKCHCCGDMLTAGLKFKLARVKNVQYYTDYSLKKSINETGDNDEMLCHSCTPEDLFKYRKKVWRSTKKAALHTGYTRPHL